MAQGDILYRAAAGWKRLAAGVSGKLLTTHGAGADPTWETAPGGAPTGAAGGDLSGTYPNPSVVDDSHAHSASTLSGVIASGSAAGGDLNGTYPSPSVTDDSHAHTEATLNLSDVTTDDVSITRHGFAPKAPNDATRYLDGAGNYSTPTGSGSPGTDTNGFLIVPPMDRASADIQGLAVNNRVYLWSIHVPQQITIATASIRVNASGGATVVGIGFFTNAGALITHQVATLSAGAGVKVLTFTSAPTLNPGTYFVAITTPNVALSGFYGILINADFELIMQSQHIRLGYATNVSALGVFPGTTGTVLALTSAFFFPFIKFETT